MDDLSPPRSEPEATDGSPTAMEALHDYRLVVRSRETSLLGRKEVLTGKAKFGIFGAGKELAQIAMARVFRPGDVRSGYYRDQTFMLAIGELTVRQFFAQLYAHADPEADPASAGRQMNAHFATPFLDDDGRFHRLVDMRSTSADVSPTGSQMPRLVGLAFASRLYRDRPELAEHGERFSRRGDEVAFGTIGNASCAEGMFWESINAAGVLKAPMLVSIWDDAYGISVPNAHQVTKEDPGALLSGFGRVDGRGDGFELFTVRGWDYPALLETYELAAALCRRDHVPIIVHVTELTQPQGHSTSGSHERYKSAERLAWEAEHDCLHRFRQFLVEREIASPEELDRLEEEERERVREEQRTAWAAFRQPLDRERSELLGLLDPLARAEPEIAPLVDLLRRQPSPLRRDLVSVAREVLVRTVGSSAPERAEVAVWRRSALAEGARLYGRHLHCENGRAALEVPAVPARFDDDAPLVNGFDIVNACFEAALERYPELLAFGEDLGQLGDVNQGFAGLQEKFGEQRVSDTGIRECTIIGQAIGLAMRGFRPIAEIQYLDYLLYALQIMSDDLATLRWRSAGRQMAPVLVRTRGHRLEGVWHSGSPMGTIVHALRGLYVCVPRNMTQAAGFYNTLLRSDDPALVVEVLNGYRVKERLPTNIDSFTVPLGVPEVLRTGRDVTLVTYGACCRIALEAAEFLAARGIEVEVVDVQTLIPFDRPATITESLRRTGRLLILDEDVPGGASAYLLREIVETQRGFWWLDSEPRTVTARPHRPAYGSDGDYFSKPSREDVIEAVWALMSEADPRSFPPLP